MATDAFCVSEITIERWQLNLVMRAPRWNLVILARATREAASMCACACVSFCLVCLCPFASAPLCPCVSVSESVSWVHHCAHVNPIRFPTAYCHHGARGLKYKMAVISPEIGTLNEFPLKKASSVLDASCGMNDSGHPINLKSALALIMESRP